MEKMTLSEAIPGNSYFIREIRDEIRLTNRLSSMGILAGTRIEVCQNHKKQPVLLFASDTLVAIGRTECTMSKCDACGSSKTCRYHGESKFYHKDDGTPVIALLGQPNSGKSTIFNLITGSHQHVGNWPGKTVDQKEGEFKWNGQKMILADLPGSYSLSAGSDEEVITREYISAGNADLLFV